MCKPDFLLVIIALCGTLIPQDSGDSWKVGRPGVKEIQVPFASLRASATFGIGATADWVLATREAVWVAGTNPQAVFRIDPKINGMDATVIIPGEACSGMAAGFGSVWVPICGKNAGLIRIDAEKKTIIATLPIAPAAPEGGIAASEDSVWMVTDRNGTLARIDPSTNKLKQEIAIPAGSYNPVFSNGVVWVSGFESNVVTAVDAATGKILKSVRVGPKPRFLTAGGGSIWTLNQGDGSVSRIDEKTRKVVATIQVGIPGAGGDIDYGSGAVWPTVFGVPLTRIDAETNKVVRQWVGDGGDSLRCGFGSIWIADYKKGTVSRIRMEDVSASPR